MERLLVISTDSHCLPHPDHLRGFLDPGLREEFDERFAPRLAAEVGLRANPTARRFVDNDRGEGVAGYWDFGIRLQEMELDGVVADVIIPNGAPFLAPKVDRVNGKDPSAGYEDPEKRRAGARAYNRWVGDRCAENPGRHAGTILFTYDDMDHAVADVQEAYDAGVRGGVMLPEDTGPYPWLNDDRYEPLWEICEGLDLPAVTHASTFSTGMKDPRLRGRGADALAAQECWMSLRRIFSVLFWGEVFEGHPRLKLVFTEQGIDWIPGAVAATAHYYDGTKSMEFMSHMDFGANAVELGRRGNLTRGPHEVWATQCYAGASFLARPEVDLRYELGVDRIMWGSDYPHLEGTWPNTKRWIHDALAGLPEQEVRDILGENALRCFSAAFDRRKLEAVAERIGPTADSLRVAQTA